MIRDLYIIALYDYFYYDKIDDSPVENKCIIGYFFDVKRKDKVIEMCNKLKEKRKEVIVKKIPFECSPNQKYVYELYYEYSIIRFGEYEDYYDIFEPFSSRKKCIEKKKELLKESKFQHRDYKIYDDHTDKGFYIVKTRINNVFNFSYDEIHKYVDE